MERPHRHPSQWAMCSCVRILELAHKNPGELITDIATNPVVGNRTVSLLEMFTLQIDDRQLTAFHPTFWESTVKHLLHTIVLKEITRLRISTLRETGSPSPSSCPFPVTRCLVGENVSRPLFWLGFGLAYACLGSVHSVAAAVSLHVQLSCASRGHCFRGVISCLGSLDSLEVGGEGISNIISSTIFKTFRGSSPPSRGDGSLHHCLWEDGCTCHVGSSWQVCRKRLHQGLQLWFNKTLFANKGQEWVGSISSSTANAETSKINGGLEITCRWTECWLTLRSGAHTSLWAPRSLWKARSPLDWSWPSVHPSGLTLGKNAKIKTSRRRSISTWACDRDFDVTGLSIWDTLLLGCEGWLSGCLADGF